MSRSTDPIDRLLDATFEIHRILRHEMMCGIGSRVNFQQVHALWIISERPNLTMKELATALHITSPSATTFADRLVKLAWVARKADPKNRKLVRLSVTETGKKVLKDMHRERRKVVGHFFSLLSTRELSQLADLHDTLLQRYREAPSTR